MATKEQYSNFQWQNSSEHENGDAREWVSDHGRGEACRTCQSQIGVRHVLDDDGRYVTLCADCRAVFTDGDRR